MAKLLKTCLITILLIASIPAFSQYKNGAGVMLGSPLGVSLAHYTRDGKMIDLVFSFSRGGESFRIHSDYTFMKKNAFKFEDHSYHVYYGAGIKYVSGKDGKENELGIRVPGAIFARMEKAPVEFALEVAPVINVVETTAFELDLGLIIRYMFN